MPPKILLLALVLLSGSIRTSAQSTDSILYEQNVDEVWQNGSLNIFSYDELCRTNTILSKTWDIAAKTWLNSTLSKIKYNDAGAVSEDVTQTWNSDKQEWVNSSSSKYEELNNGKTYMLTFLRWDAFSNTWQNDNRMTYLFNDAGYSYYYLHEFYINNSWQPAFNYTDKYDSNNHVVSTTGQNYQNGTWINSYKLAYRYSKNGLHVGIMYYYWNMGLQEWSKSNRQETNYLPQGMAYKNSISQYHDYLTNHWINSAYSVNKFNSKQQAISFMTAFWNTGTNQWDKNYRYRTDYYDDGSINHFYYDLWDDASAAWNTAARTTYTHHGCLLELDVTTDERNESTNKANQRMMGNMGADKRITDIRDGGRSWSYDVPLHSSNSRQQNITQLHFTIKAKPAGTAHIINKALITKATLPTVNNAFAISPNPAKGYFVVTPGMHAQPAADAILKLYDLSGKVILARKLPGTGAQTIALPPIAKGLYIVTITSAKGVQTMKLAVE